MLFRRLIRQSSPLKSLRTLSVDTDLSLTQVFQLTGNLSSVADPDLEDSGLFGDLDPGEKSDPDLKDQKSTKIIVEFSERRLFLVQKMYYGNTLFF